MGIHDYVSTILIVNFIDGGNDLILISCSGNHIFGQLENHLKEHKSFQMMDILLSTHKILEMVNDHVLSELLGELI